MRTSILALLVLSGVAAAQRPRVPILHRDVVGAERAALHEKLTRLAETRKSLGMPEAQPGSTAELDALTAATRPKRPAARATHQRVSRPAAVTQSAWPPPPQVWTAGEQEQEPSLGEVARKYRAEKRRAHSNQSGAVASGNQN